MLKLKIPREVGALIFIAFMVFLGFILPVTLTLGNQELNNQDVSFRIFLFSLLLGVGIIGTTALYFTRYWWRGDNKYGDSFGFFSIGSKPSLKMFSKFSAFQLGLLAMILFSSVFLVTNMFQVGGFTSTILLPQQFSPGESLAFSTLLIPTAEESMNIFVIGILVLALVLFAVKTKMRPQDFLVYYFIIIPIIIGIFGVIWHGSAYPNSDIAKTIVFMFWSIKAFLILATGFMFIGMAMHLNNNFFLDFTRLFGSDLARGVVIFFIIGMAILYWLLYKNDSKWYKGANVGG